MNNENKKSISEAVISKIKQSHIKARPKMYFIFKMVLLAAGLAFLTLSAVFLTSFILFSMRQGGLFFLPALGLPGVRMFFLSVPWLLILVAVALVITSEFFAKHFSFVYKRPIVYSVLAIIVIVVFGAIALDFTPLHANLLLTAQKGDLIFAGHFYRELGAPKIPDVHYGSIIEITDNGFKITTNRGEELDVVVSKDTKIFDKDVKQGDSIMVLGKRIDQSVNAANIRKVDENRGFLPPPRFFRKQMPMGPGAIMEIMPR